MDYATKTVKNKVLMRDKRVRSSFRFIQIHADSDSFAFMKIIQRGKEVRSKE